jgi:hypothetical protein
MLQRALSSALVPVIALALASCGQPAGVEKAATANSANPPGIIISNPRVAEATGGGPFPAVPSGYRGLGGAFMNQGTLVVVTPDTHAPMQKHDLDVGLLHGMAAGGYSESAAQKVQKSDCVGRGDTAENAIKVGSAEPADEVADGIACARLLHPGTHWLLSQLITRGDGYLSQILLRDGDGNDVIVFADVNRMADQLITELGG